MSGGGNPIKKIKKEIKKVSAEDALSLGMNRVYGKVHEKTGVKADILSPGTWLGGEAGEKLYDKPKAAKQAAKRMAAEAKTAQESILAQRKQQEKQTEAEGEAAKQLARSKAKQQRKSKGSGRRSTILTDKLGAVGGEEGGRKSLLGL